MFYPHSSWYHTQEKAEVGSLPLDALRFVEASQGCSTQKIGHAAIADWRRQSVFPVCRTDMAWVAWYLVGFGHRAASV